MEETKKLYDGLVATKKYTVADIYKMGDVMNDASFFTGSVIDDLAQNILFPMMEQLGTNTIKKHFQVWAKERGVELV